MRFTFTVLCLAASLLFLLNASEARAQCQGGSCQILPSRVFGPIQGQACESGSCQVPTSQPRFLFASQPIRQASFQAAQTCRSSGQSQSPGSCSSAPPRGRLLGLFRGRCR